MSSHFFFLLIFIVIKFIAWACKELDIDFFEELFGDASGKNRYRRKQRNRDKYKSTNRSLRPSRIASSLGGYVTQSIAGGPAIGFKRKGVSFEAAVSTVRGLSTLKVSAPWIDKDFQLHVFPDWQGGRLPNFPNNEDVKIGVVSFDADFVIHTSQPDIAKQLLTRRICKRIYNDVKHAYRRFDLKISGGQFHIASKSTSVLQHRQAVTLIKNLADIYLLILQTAKATQIDPAQVQMTYIENDTSICMVCGEDVREPAAVHCVKCNTPHHKECWEYIGRCSTYGCTSRRAR